MSRIWIQIKIGEKVLSPIMIYNGNAACHSNTMPTLSCILNIPLKMVEVPIDLVYQEGDISCYKEIYSERIYLFREKGFVNTLSTILGRDRVSPIKIDVFFNENEEGLCIGFLASRFRPTKYVVKNEYWIPLSSKTKTTSGVSIGKNAKEVFVKNYQRFEELLPITSVHADNDIVFKWEGVIKSIDESDALLMDFEKYKENFDAWLKLLYSWGLKQDGCRQYPGILINADYYVTDDSLSIDKKQTYKVIVPCWTIWIEKNGKRTESLVSKGLVKAI